jgi:hypothetical protein
MAGRRVVVACGYEEKGLQKMDLTGVSKYVTEYKALHKKVSIHLYVDVFRSSRPSCLERVL